MSSPRNLFSTIALLVISFTSLPSLAQAPPSADAYVTTTQPAANFGNSSLLPVLAGTTSYVRFNLGVLPANASVTKATLRLYVDAVTAPGAFDVYQAVSSWSESGLSFNNAPAMGTSATGGQPLLVTAASVNQFLLVDITTLVQGWLNGSVPNYGVALVLNGSIGSFSFDSKESTGTGHQPELVVVLASSSGISTTGPSDPYVDNSTTLQASANFNIAGTGSASTFNATSQYLLAGMPAFGINGTSSLFVGPGAGNSNTGLQNTFVGVSSGQVNTTGNNNSFMGDHAGFSNTTGSLLTFLGMQSGYSNTVGSYNSFVGGNSGYSNTTGSYNVFMGNGSGRSNTTGSFLTFLGLQSGLSNTTGNNNSFIGTHSGFSNTTGTSLTFLGMESGYSNSVGSYNSFVGGNSGYSNTTGSYNVFMGNGSGRSNTTGSFLTFLGLQSGLSNTTGNNNSFIGTSSGFNNTSGSNNTFVGYNAGLNADPAANNNVYISSLGTLGDNRTIRIGDPANQTAAYVAGIYGNAPGGALPVVVNANGQLGTSTAGIGVTSFNGRTGAVVPAASDYSFSQIAGTLPFSQLSGSLASSQLSGTYTAPVVLSNTTNVIAGSFNGNFTGNGSGVTGVASGLTWPMVPISADYALQLSDFATATTRGNYLVLRGTLSHTFTLPNPPPPNGSCVAIGNAADAGINSGSNVFLTVSPNGVNMDTFTSGNSVTPTMPRHTSYLYCSDGANYFRLGYAQNGVSEIGPWLETLDTGVVNLYKTTFRNGMDFGLANGSMIFLLVKAANTIGTPTLDVNGLGAKKILKYGNQALAPGDLSTVAYALLIYDGLEWQLINPQTTRSTLTGTTGTIGGAALTAGSCTSGTAAVTGATVGHPVSVSAADGSLPNGLIVLSGAVTSANVVTVQLCAIAPVTPTANIYNVATQ